MNVLMAFLFSCVAVSSFTNSLDSTLKSLHAKAITHHAQHNTNHTQHKNTEPPCEEETEEEEEETEKKQKHVKSVTLNSFFAVIHCFENKQHYSELVVKRIKRPPRVQS